jgi:hypothetical protein
VGLFVRDLDSIDLPAHGSWRPAPRKESAFMKTSRYLLTAGLVAAVLLLAIIVTFNLRGSNPVAAPQSASPTASTSPTSTASSSSSAAATGAITGQLGYPADMIPPLTVYAISVNDPNVWFAVNTPYFGNNPKPGVQTAAPGQRKEYTITGVAPGTYYVLGYFEARYFQTLEAGSHDTPGVYSRFTVDCIQATTSNSPPPACAAQPGDHALVPVTVRAGQTASGIDIKDWYYIQGSYPPRPR